MEQNEREYFVTINETWRKMNDEFDEMLDDLVEEVSSFMKGEVNKKARDLIYEGEDEGMEVIDELLELYREKMPETVYLVKNKDRYPVVQRAVETIKELVSHYDKEVRVKIFPDELIGTTLCVEITTSLFVIKDMGKFCEILKLADTFEVTPLITGDICVGMTFENTWEPAPPYRAN